MHERVVYACDVGSTRSGAFGWVRQERRGSMPWGGGAIARLLDSLQADLRDGRSVVLGLEAPLFLPVPRSHEELSRGRRVDRDRSAFAPAGGYVATLALHQAAFLLRRLREVPARHGYTTYPAAWRRSEGEPVLFLWEAFVAGPAHADRDDPRAHLLDAATAASAFWSWTAGERPADDPGEPGNCLSLIGAAALWAGWTSDPAALHGACLVVRPDASERYRGEVLPAG